MLRLSAFLLLLATLGACSGTRPAPDERPDEGALPTPAQIDHSAYETFDASPYRESAPVAGPEGPRHDVPAGLMEGTYATPQIAPGTRQTVDGFRVQVYQTTDKDEADTRVDEAVAWWNSRFEGRTPEVYTVFRTPYYRIRVGNYATRDAANEALRSLRARFPNAQLVPDRVTVVVR
jgi:hypothetical protein